jgi:two-component system sensor histidine kinase YesM
LPNDTSKEISINSTIYLVTTGVIDGIDLKIVYIEKRTGLYKSIEKIYVFEMLLLGGTCVVLILAFYMITSGVIHPLENLIYHIEWLRSHENTVRDASTSGSLEIRKLVIQFNALINEKRQLTQNLLTLQNNLYESELNRKQMEITMLKSQINPHFLSNALEAMLGIALRDGHNILGLMIKHLGSIFRYSIRAPEYVRLSDEIFMLEAYLAIQQLRFGEKFEWITNIPEDAKHSVIPKMILQPIVENSIEHGFGMMKSGGRLHITATIEEKFLKICVYDNGTGIQSAKLAKLKHKLHSYGKKKFLQSSTRTGLGLLNVHYRIRLLYGADCGLNIESKDGEGTNITLILYNRREDDVQCFDCRR